MSLSTIAVFTKEAANLSNRTVASIKKLLGSSLLLIVLSLCVFNAGAQVQVTATAGAMGPINYATLNAAFTAVNNGTHQGAITLSITANTTEPSVSVPLLRSNLPSSYSSVLIRPVGGNFTINSAAAPTASRGVIELHGADNVTIDGDDPTTAGTKNLTFQSSTSTSTGIAVIRIASTSTLGTDGATNVTVRNCNIIGSRASATATNTNYGINISNSSSITTSSFSSNNILIENNSITRCYHGVFMPTGGSATFPNLGVVIRGNVLGSAVGSDNIGSRGIYLSYTSGAIVELNDIRVGDVSPTGAGYSASIGGIELNTSNPGVIVRRNNIHDVMQPSTGGWGAYGIQISGISADVTIENNFIRDMVATRYTSGTATSSFINYGIFISAGSTNIKINHNTIALLVPNQTSTLVNNFSNCVGVTTGTPVISQFQNNILINNNASTVATGVYTSATGNISTAAFSNNAYYLPSGSRLGFYNAISYTTLASWQAATAKDANSLSLGLIPPFASATDLHIPDGSSTELESAGIGLPSVVTDFDGQARNSSTPDIGADEFNGVSYAPGTINTVSSVAGNSCVAAAHPVTANITAGTAPITSVVLNYSFNGVAQTPINMTGGTATGTSNWSGSIPAAVPGNATVIYSVTFNDGFSSLTSVASSYSDEPLNGKTAIITAAQNPICSGTGTTLTAAIVQSGTVTLGSGTLTSTSAATNPFYGIWGGAKTQYIVRASELIALGLGAGNINSLGINITSAGSTLSGFAIAMESTSLTAFVSPSDIKPVTNTVYSNPSWVPVNGLNTFTFSSPFNWDGFSNVIISFCWSNNNASNTTSTINYHTPGFITSQVRYADNATSADVCNYTGTGTVLGSGNGSTTSSNRPIFTFNGVLSFPFTSVLWNTGETTATITTPALTSATTYSVTLTNASGCSISSAPFTVNVLPLPPAPTNPAPSTQCGDGVPTAFVLGGTSGNYRWYLTPTGGTALANEYDNVLSSYSINTTTTFYIAITNGTCESLRTPVVATVTAPDALTATASHTGASCLGKTYTLLATKAAGPNNYSYTWSVLSANAATAGLSGTTTASVTATPTAVGTYVFQVAGADGSCNTSATVTIVVNVNPTIISVTANPSTVCANESVTLTASSTVSGTVGTGTLSTTSSYSPLSRADEGARRQYLVRASELNTAGIFGPRVLSSISFNVTTNPVLLPNNLNGYTIKLAHTATATVAGFETASFTQVYGPVNYNPVTGANKFDFTGTFTWDGTSNVLVEVCYENDANNTCGDGSPICWGNTPSVSYATTSFTSVAYHSSDNTTGPRDLCGPTYPSLTGTTTLRPIMIFTALNVYNWNWSSGGTGLTTVVNPTNSGAYTVTATDQTSGCTTESDPVAVTVNPRPATPSANLSIQCGTKTPEAYVQSNSGAATPVFAWYLDQVGGTPIPGQTGSYLVNYPISSTVTFWVSEISAAGCEGERVELLAFVTDADVVTATASSSTVCVNSPLTLGYTQAGANQNYAITWSASPETGSGITNGSTVTGPITPTLAGTYVYTLSGIDGDCTAQSSVTVTVRPTPLVTSATASASTICAGQPVTLTAKTIADGVGNATLGAGATTTASFNAPFYSLWSNKHMQMIVPASELTAIGLRAGNITKLSFPATAADTDVPQGYTIQMAHTTATTMAAFVTTGLSQVYYRAVQPFSVSNNTLTLDAAFTWNGTDNIVIDICFGGINGNTMSNTARADATSYVSVIKTHTSATTGSAAACANNTANVLTYSVRPVIIFEGIVGTDITANYSWNWVPGGTGAVVSVSPVTTTNYQVTAIDAFGCTSLASSVPVTVNPLPGAPNAASSSQCGYGVPTAAVSGSGGGTGLFKWYDAATGGNLVNTGATFTTPITSTTQWWVSETNASTGCEGPRTLLTATVNPTDPVTATASAAAVCLGGSFNLTASKTGSTQTYTYSWSVISANAATAGLSSPSGVSVSATPTAPGTYILRTVGYDAALSCSAFDDITLVVNDNPLISSVTATPSTVCTGGTAQLQAKSVPALTGTTTIGAQTTTGITGGPYRAGAGTTVGNKVQYLFTAAELTAGGVAPGNITSIGFNVTSTGTMSALPGFQIKMGTSTLSDLTSTFEASPATTVYGPLTYTPNTGLNTHVFTTAFLWDGISNLLVEICNPPINPTGSSLNVSLYVPGGTKMVSSNSAAACATATGSTSTNRPVITFGGQVGTDISSSLNWVWSPGGNTGSIVNVNPVTTTNYTVTATNPATGCQTTSAPVTVTVEPLACNGITVSTVRCANTAFTLTANTLGGNAVSQVYSWSDGVGGAYPNSATINPILPAGTYNFSVTIVNSCGQTVTCTQSVLVNQLPTINITATPGAVICGPGGSVSLAATGANGYLWTPATGLSSTSSATVTANPSSTTTYTITGTDANGCVNSTTQTVVVGPANTVAPTASQSSVCFGSNVNLSANLNTGNFYNASRYAFTSATGGVLDPMTGAATVVAASVDDNVSTVQNIGFSFRFDGVDYTQFTASPDGWIKLGSVVATNDFTNDLNESTNLPKLAAYWDDLATGVGGSVKTLLTGTAPNRILKVQWFVTMPRATTGNANSTFQMWLYEGSNKVQYVYGTNGGATGSASLGIVGTSTANFISVNSATNTASSSLELNTLTNAPAAGTVYTFDPAPYTFAWTPAAGVSDASSANPVALNVVANTTYSVLVTDNVSGCTATGTVTVNLETVPPTPPVIPVYTAECYVETNTITAPVATDNCGPVTGTTEGIIIADQGTHSIVWTFTDASGNTSTATQTIIIDDMTAPVAPSLPVLTGECSVTAPPTSAEDVCMKTIAGVPTDPTTGNVLASTTFSTQGTHVIRWKFDDGNGNISYSDQTIIIDDVTPPAITCPADIIISACEPVASWSAPVATDNCAYGLTVTQTGGPVSGSTFANGSTTTITYRAVDAGGNISTCSFTVTRRAALTAASTYTTILCNGATSLVTVTAAGGLAPYTGVGTFTVNAGTYSFTVTDADGCTAITTGTIGQPTAIVPSCSTNNSEIFFGYSPDNTATITTSATGGTGPYTISYSMDRAMKCNVTDAAGDETWVGGAGTVSNVNTVCPASGSGAVPVSTSGTLTAGQTYSLTVSLMQNAVITATITDANGCIEKCTTPVFAKDVRCYTGSGIWKVKVCHITGSGCNATCVNLDAVAAHLAHGDFLGDCTATCAAPAPGGKTINTKQEVVAPDAFSVTAFPNPSTTEFTLNINTLNKTDKLLVNLYDATGKLYKQFRGTPDQLIKVGKELKAGVYLVEVTQAGNRKTTTLVKQ